MPGQRTAPRRVQRRVRPTAAHSTFGWFATAPSVREVEILLAPVLIWGTAGEQYEEPMLRGHTLLGKYGIFRDVNSVLACRKHNAEIRTRFFVRGSFSGPMHPVSAASECENAEQPKSLKPDEQRQARRGKANRHNSGRRAPANEVRQGSGADNEHEQQNKCWLEELMRGIHEPRRSELKSPAPEQQVEGRDKREKERSRKCHGGSSFPCHTRIGIRFGLTDRTLTRAAPPRASA